MDLIQLAKWSRAAVALVSATSLTMNTPITSSAEPALPITTDSTVLQVIGCSLALCGGFLQNVATLQLSSGSVVVDQSEKTTVSLSSVRDILSGAPAANKSSTCFMARSSLAVPTSLFLAR